MLAVVLLPYAAPSEMLVSAQRTSVTTPKIVSKEQVTVYPASAAKDPIGAPETRISYVFSVGPNSYNGVATHRWSADQIVSAKVCYHPNNIDGSHAIELATYQCGSLDLHPNG